MATVELTKHLFRFFPALEGKELVVEAETVAEVVRELERLAPGLAFYLCDELGRLRRHVNIFVGDESIADRKKLSDRVDGGSRVLIMQALSGGCGADAGGGRPTPGRGAARSAAGTPQKNTVGG